MRTHLLHTDRINCCCKLCRHKLSYYKAHHENHAVIYSPDKGLRGEITLSDSTGRVRPGYISIPAGGSEERIQQ